GIVNRAPSKAALAFAAHWLAPATLLPRRTPKRKRVSRPKARPCGRNLHLFEGAGRDPESTYESACVLECGADAAWRVRSQGVARAFKNRGRLRKGPQGPVLHTRANASPGTAAKSMGFICSMR